MGETVSEETKEKTRLRSASRSELPIASIIPDKDTFESVVSLLREASGLKVQVSESEERLKEIQTELAAISEIYGGKGFRHGRAGFEYRGMTSRSSLKKPKLIELLSSHGIPASDLEACYEEGTPFLDARVVIFDID